MSRFGAQASVIDPQDTRGRKNKYIQMHRDAQIASAFEPLASGSRVLDLGCGTGNITRYLNDLGLNAVGIDIAFKLMSLCQGTASLINYDGRRIPFRDNCFDAAVNYVVLNHILDDAQLAAVMLEVKRVLKPGAIHVCIEQTRSKTRVTDGGQKKQRRIEDFEALFVATGLSVESVRVVRAGHFPLIYLIRYGLIPVKLFPLMISMDKGYSAVLSKLPVDYFDTFFVLRKPLP